MQSESGPEEPKDRAQSALVCVVDDDDRLRQAVCAVLNQAGFATVEASDGEMALKIVAERKPTIVITDIVMPKLEGIETIQALKKAFPQMPILAMSGGHKPGKEYLDWARELGADDCLAKPFQLAELVEKVTRLVAQGK